MVNLLDQLHVVNGADVATREFAQVGLGLFLGSLAGEEVCVLRSGAGLL